MDETFCTIISQNGKIMCFEWRLERERKSRALRYLEVKSDKLVRGGGVRAGKRTARVI